MCLVWGDDAAILSQATTVTTQIFKTRISNLLKLEFSGEALGDSVDEVGEGERSTTIPVREKKDIMDNQDHLYVN